MPSFVSLGCQENGSQVSPCWYSCGIVTSMRRLPVRFSSFDKGVGSGENCAVSAWACIVPAARQHNSIVLHATQYNRIAGQHHRPLPHVSCVHRRSSGEPNGSTPYRMSSSGLKVQLTLHLLFLVKIVDYYSELLPKLAPVLFVTPRSVDPGHLCRVLRFGFCITAGLAILLRSDRGRIFSPGWRVGGNRVGPLVCPI